VVVIEALEAVDDVLSFGDGGLGGAFDVDSAHGYGGRGREVLLGVRRREEGGRRRKKEGEEGRRRRREKKEEGGRWREKEGEGRKGGCVGRRSS
jgi:hypothetical protein